VTHGLSGTTTDPVSTSSSGRAVSAGATDMAPI
jgi:hypothetical protein